MIKLSLHFYIWKCRNNVCKKRAMLKAEQVILSNICMAGLSPVEDFFLWFITLLDTQVFLARSPNQGDYSFLVH